MFARLIRAFAPIICLDISKLRRAYSEKVLVSSTHEAEIGGVSCGIIVGFIIIKHHKRIFYSTSEYDRTRGAIGQYFYAGFRTEG